MKLLVALGILVGFSGCAADQFSANQACAGTAGCVSSFTDTGYGPIQAQAVAPAAPGGVQPQN